ncbi:hypothetical protein ACC848_38905, partial [Rhizobium johnstonii]
MSVDDGPAVAASLSVREGDTIAVIDGLARRIVTAGDWLVGSGGAVQITIAAAERSGRVDAAASPQLVSPMPGTV